VFCRLLDKDKGGYFSISPPVELNCTTKQQYLPSSSILQTRYIHEDGVADVVDFFPRPKSAKILTRSNKQSVYREATKVQEELKKWLVRRVQCIRGSMDLGSYMAIQYRSLIPRDRKPHTRLTHGIQISRYSQRLTTHGRSMSQRSIKSHTPPKMSVARWQLSTPRTSSCS
jgi:GH15 family glucan-1,4-alpha-glucosidase